MARLSEHIKPYKLFCAAQPPENPLIGGVNCPGMNTFSMPTSASLSPFECCMEYQLPFFLSQEEEVEVPSA